MFSKKRSLFARDNRMQLTQSQAKNRCFLLRYVRSVAKGRGGKLLRVATPSLAFQPSALTLCTYPIYRLRLRRTRKTQKLGAQALRLVRLRRTMNRRGRAPP